MAIYEYDCPKCGTFEVSQKMSDAPLEVHEACGSKVERRISLTSFALKGGGWYSDGYASKKHGSGQAAPACGSSACAGSGCPNASA
jgi:putative FmdB family regulatory protein